MRARRSAIFRIASASLAIGASAARSFAIPWPLARGVKNANLAAAGRCISVSTDMWDITRVIPTAAMTGQAAAWARRWPQRREEALGSLPIALLQEALRANGAIVEAP